MSTTATKDGVTEVKGNPNVVKDKLSPFQKRRQYMIRRTTYDLTHTLLCIGLALSCFAKIHGGFGSAPTWAQHAQDIKASVSAEPVEAVCAVLTYFFIVSMCGNSPVAFAVAHFFGSVDMTMWNRYTAFIEATFGKLYDPGYGCVALGCVAIGLFIGFYIFHGLLLLPLDLHAATHNRMLRFKLQPKSPSFRHKLGKVIKCTAFNLLCITPPYVLACMVPTLTSSGARGIRLEGDLPMPSERICLLIGHLLVNEVLFFYAHWWLHSKKFLGKYNLYVMFHKQHHEFQAPFALAALYAHPLEFVLADLIPFTAGFFLFRPHIFFVYIWIVGACLGTMTHHSGYRLPWIAGPDENPDFHDFHHQKFDVNFGNIGWLDTLHGTNCRYNEKHALAKAQLNADQKLWQEARK